MKSKVSFLSDALCLTLLVLLGGPCLNRTAPSAAAEGVGAERSVPVIRVERTDEAPLIDGRLDDPAWQNAAVIPGLTLVERGEETVPRRKTVVLLLFDDDFLYLGIRAFDDEPGRIVATEMQRDDRFRSDDRIEIVLDTFHTRRNAYLFRVNPLGARSDGLIESGRLVSEEWNGIWFAGASIDEPGWTAEIAIPFKTVAFDPGGTSWGFNIERVVRRDNEISRWATPHHARSIEEVSGAGIIEGLDGIKKGIGLDLKPSLTLRHRSGSEVSGRTREAVPSFDAFYRVTSSLTASITVNTDFSETEVDERDMDLSRFQPFFPEKRAFFLQDAGLFEFGNIRRNARPFFSRRIGLDDDGREVGIIAGGKLTGRAGPVNMGLLGVRTDKSGELGKKTLSVARANFNVFEQSTVGFIVTDGDPRGRGGGPVVGVDAFLRTSRLPDEKVLSGNLWVQRSFNESAGSDEWAWGGQAEFPNEPLNLSLGFTEIQRNFDPPLGFVNRSDIREYEFNSRYRRRFRPPGIVRRFDCRLNCGVVTDTNDALESISVRGDILQLQNAAGDSFRLTQRYIHERIEEDFRIARGRIRIPAGNFSDYRTSVELEASDARTLSGSMEVGGGDFYNGKILEVKPKLALRLAPRLRLSSEYEFVRIDNPAGKVDIGLLKCRAIVQFSPELSLNTFVQYDNLSDMIGISTRLRWSMQSGHDVFIVFNRAGESATETAVKVSWTLRF